MRVTASPRGVVYQPGDYRDLSVPPLVDMPLLRGTLA